MRKHQWIVLVRLNGAEGDDMSWQWADDSDYGLPSKKDEKVLMAWCRERYREAFGHNPERESLVAFPWQGRDGELSPWTALTEAVI